MKIPLSHEIYLYLAFICLFVAFFLYNRSIQRRKKELDQRRSLSDRFRRKRKEEKVI